MKNIFSIKAGLLALLFLNGNDIVHESTATTSVSGKVLVELFTSEGCSSCPPADEAVAALQKQNADKVIVLCYHVDYWNYLGWDDAFSKKEFTQRQEQYASHFNLSSIYTPQAIVNGEKEFTGSDKSMLQSVVDKDLQHTFGDVIELDASGSDDKNISVSYSVNSTSQNDITIALIQLSALIPVKRGENAGKKLQHINIVRDLKSFDLSKQNKGKANFTIPEGLNKNNVHIVAFFQQNNSLAITAAKEISIQ
ncbi:MAG: DUF1223 domain-containing protein [Bacteroidetes bacterium]|nr:DUF1223 domain-containing protein [Bacteroidota bacterium]